MNKKGKVFLELHNMVVFGPKRLRFRSAIKLIKPAYMSYDGFVDRYGYYRLRKVFDRSKKKAYWARHSALYMKELERLFESLE